MAFTFITKQQKLKLPYSALSSCCGIYIHNKPIETYRNLSSSQQKTSSPTPSIPFLFLAQYAEI
ncbi:MAG: hypothetical protein ACTTHY_05695, partial [Prevotella intermedia]